VTDTQQRAIEERRAHDARMPSVDFNLSPFTIAWELTRACAFACRHCRAEAQPKRNPAELSTDEAFAVIDQIKEFGDPILVITGGDPMMRQDVFDILAYASGRGLRTSLTPTTTRLVTLEKLRRAREAGVRRVAVSIDGPSADSHDAFRGFRGSFDMAVGIARMVADAGLSLQVNTTLSRYNFDVRDRFPDLITDLQAVQWSVFFLVPTGRAARNDMISAEDHEVAFQWLYDLSKTSPFDIKSTAAPAYRRVVIQRERQNGAGKPVLAGAGYRYEDGLNRPVQGVNDGRGFCFISHTGDVCPSGFLPIPAGNVRTETVTSVYRESRLFRELRDPKLLKGKCARCPFRDVCGGSRARAFATTGDYLESDPSCVYDPPSEGARPSPTAESAASPN
jgi:radical SAM protein